MAIEVRQFQGGFSTLLYGSLNILICEERVKNDLVGNHLTFCNLKARNLEQGALQRKKNNSEGQTFTFQKVDAWVSPRMHLSF